MTANAAEAPFEQADQPDLALIAYPSQLGRLACTQAEKIRERYTVAATSGELLPDTASELAATRLSQVQTWKRSMKLTAEDRSMLGMNKR